METMLYLNRSKPLKFQAVKTFEICTKKSKFCFHCHLHKVIEYVRHDPLKIPFKAPSEFPVNRCLFYFWRFIQQRLSEFRKTEQLITETKFCAHKIKNYVLVLPKTY